jgi:hypothetical protein
VADVEHHAQPVRGFDAIEDQQPAPGRVADADERRLTGLGRNPLERGAQAGCDGLVRRARRPSASAAGPSR